MGHQLVQSYEQWMASLIWQSCNFICVRKLLQNNLYISSSVTYTILRFLFWMLLVALPPQMYSWHWTLPLNEYHSCTVLERFHVQVVGLRPAIQNVFPSRPVNCWSSAPKIHHNHPLPFRSIIHLSIQHCMTSTLAELSIISHMSMNIVHFNEYGVSNREFNRKLHEYCPN